MACLEGPQRDVKAVCVPRAPGPGTHAFIRAGGGVLRCSQAKPDQKEQFGLLPRGCY